MKKKGLNINEDKLRDLYLRDLMIGKLYGPLTGKASKDKPYLKYASEEAIMADYPDEKIYDYLYECNAEHMDDVALEYYGREITYREFFDNIDKFSKSFKAYGVNSGDVVTVGMLTTPESIYTMLALNKIGAIPSMIDPRSSVAGLHKYLEDNNSDLVIATDIFAKNIIDAMADTSTKKLILSSVLASMYDEVATSESFKDLYALKNMPIFNDKVVRLDDFLTKGQEYNGSIESEYMSDRVALIVHSGGTTGFPKAVMMSDKNVIASIYQAELTDLELNRGESWLGIMPPFIIYGASAGTFLPLARGMKLQLYPLFSPEQLPEMLIEHKPVHMTLAPSHFGILINSEKLKDADLSFCVTPTVGGDKMDVELEKASNEWLAAHGCKYKVSKGYGSSESCSGVSMTYNDDWNEIGSVGAIYPKNLASIFKPIEDLEEASSYEELGYNEIGEVCISGPTVMIGYFGNEKSTNEILREHEDGKLWLHTRDLGYMTEDGKLFVLDRIKRMIINNGGFKILPSYVETVINKHPNVKDCSVIGLPDNEHSQGEVPVAVLELHDNSVQDETIQEVSEMCMFELKDNISWPDSYYVVSEIPHKQSNGKTDLQQLKNSILSENSKSGNVKILKKVKKGV